MKTTRKSARGRKAEQAKARSAKAVKKITEKEQREHPHVAPHDTLSDFLSREVGWLRFNRRVLNEALDFRNPVLERIRFLSISQSNLDEFFMKQVGGVKRRIALGVQTRSADGKLPHQLLSEIRTHVLDMVGAQAFIFNQSLKPALAEQGIHLQNWGELSALDRDWAERYYTKNVFPVLTPLSVDPGHPFPFISNLSTSLGVVLKHPGKEERFFARVKVPQVLPQWIRINPEGESASFRYISLLELIRGNLSDLFPSMQVLSSMPFRLTRNADVIHEDDDHEDLLEMVEEEVRLRRFAEVVRLEHGPNPDPWILAFLTEELDLNPEDVYELPGDLDYRGLTNIADLELPKLKYTPWAPAVPMAFEEKDTQHIFNTIRKGDQLFHHPYESFTATVERLIRIAADDPKVLAIKMTLYRTGDNSAFVSSLVRAAENGKQVVCLVELKARFDEERNIHWAQELESAGVHVVYGIVGLKTHAKTTLIVRQEPEGIRCYAHIATGNYNSVTSRFYTDLGLLTCRDEITQELVEFFHYLTGRSLKSDYDHLLVAPVNMKARFIDMIRREAEYAKAGRPAYVFAKMNNMDDRGLAAQLIESSQVGVNVDLVVRGFCIIRPGVRGRSERIRVMSIIGRFLEHSRIFYFRNGAVDPIDGEFFIGSADWMGRNMHARVECATPILDRSIRARLWEIIQLFVNDQRQTWDMDPTGNYEQRSKSDLGVQSRLMQTARQVNQYVDHDWNKDLG